jgi:hypothetical protein
MTAAETRSMAKITFGPVAPLRIRQETPVRPSSGAVAIVRPTRNEPARTVTAVAAAPAVVPAPAFAPRPQFGSAEPLGTRPVTGNAVRNGFGGGAEMARQPATQTAGRPSAGPANTAPRPAIAGQAYVGPSSPVVPRVIPRPAAH